MKEFAPKPCKNCPWKRSSRAGGFDIPNFSLELMKGLAKTTYPRDAHEYDRDGFRSIFACHDSKPGKECACAGYVARDGIHNINVRLLAVKSNANLMEITERANEDDLYDNFYEMLDDYVRAREEK